MTKIARTELFAVQIGGEGGGLLRFVSDRDNRRVFFGFGKFWQILFYLRRDFFGYSKTNILYFPCYII